MSSNNMDSDPAHMSTINEDNNVQKENGSNGINTILSDIYYTLSNPASFSGIQKLYTAAHKKDPLITLKIVKSWLRNQNTYSKHKIIRRKFKRRKTVQLAVDETWACDLIVPSISLRRFNYGYQYILVIEDLFSRFLWAVPLKTKSHTDVRNAFEKVIDNNHGVTPRHIYADEVSNKTVRKRDRPTGRPTDQPTSRPAGRPTNRPTN